MFFLLLNSVTFSQENCTSTVDDDLDTFIDSGDPDCFDQDGDGITDLFDEDDDNDGILDLNEYNCDTWSSGLVLWDANGSPPSKAVIQNTTRVSSAPNMIFGSGIGGSIVSTSYRMTGVNQPTLNAAIVDNDYIEFGMTLSSSVSLDYIHRLSWTKFPASTGVVANNYGYDLALFAYKDGSLASECILPNNNVPATLPAGFQWTIISIPATYYYLQPGSTYTFRLYFYNKTSGLTAWFDDFQIFGSNCNYDFDGDADGIGNHLDLESDGDHCFDASEAGFTDDNSDGLLGNSPVTVDATGRVTSGIDGYTSPNAIFNDDSNDDCFELCGNGLDDNADGVADEAIPAGISENMILWLKADVGFSAATWEDQSQYENDATVYGDPTSVSNSLNYNPGINFDGNDHMEIDLPELVFETGNNHVSILLVYTPSTVATNIGVFGNETVLAGANIGLRDGQLQTGWWSNPAVNIPQYFGTTPHLITLQIDEEDNVAGSANSSAAYLDGTLLQNFFFDEQGEIDVDSNFHIGLTGNNASSKYFQGDIQEIIIYKETDGNLSITDAERKKIETYLGLIYGISLSHDFSDSQ